MNSKEYNRKRRIVLVAIVLTIGIIAVFTFFLISNSKRLEKQNNEYLYDLTVQRAESIDTIIKDNLSFIRSAAYMYGGSLTSAEPDIKMLNDFKINTAFDELWFVDDHGFRIANGGTRIDFSDNSFYADGLHGGSGVTYFGKKARNGENKIGFYAPVFYKDSVIGILVGLYGSEFITDMLDYELFEESGDCWLCDTDGTVIGSSHPFEYINFLDFLGKAGGCKQNEIAHISRVFSYGQGASFTFQQDGDEIKCCAAAVPYPGWILIRTFPPDAYRTMLNRTNRNSLMVILILAAVFAVYIAVMSISFNREKKHLDSQKEYAQDIATGMASMFGNCLTVDLNMHTYNYVIGVPDDPNLPAEGDYLKYYDSVMSRIDDTENRRKAAVFFDIDNLTRTLTSRDSASIRLHLAREGADEWEIFKFIVLSRKDSLPERLLLVSHNASEALGE